MKTFFFLHIKLHIEEDIFNIMSESFVVPLQQVLPYEPRSFPLTDEDYGKMVEAMPSGHLLPLAAPPVCSRDEEKIDVRKRTFCNKRVLKWSSRSHADIYHLGTRHRFTIWLNGVSDVRNGRRGSQRSRMDCSWSERYGKRTNSTYGQKIGRARGQLQWFWVYVDFKGACPFIYAVEATCQLLCIPVSDDIAPCVKVWSML